MAHKKGVGSSRNGRDSAGQRLGIKRFGGEHVNAGTIIATPAWHKNPSRQERGTRAGLYRSSPRDRVVAFERMGKTRSGRVCDPKAETAGFFLKGTTAASPLFICAGRFFPYIYGEYAATGADSGVAGGFFPAEFINNDRP